MRQLVYCRSCGKEVPESATFCPSCGTSVSPGAPGFGTSQNEFDRLTRDARTQEHWIRRVVAYVIDWIIVSIATAIIYLIVSTLAGMANVIVSGPSIANFFLPFGAIGAGIFGVDALLFLLYFALSEGFYHRTLGKSFLGLQVNTTDGSTLNVPKAFIRNITKIFWLLLLLDLIGGFFTQVKPGQRFMDKIANTIVVSRN